MKTFFYFFTSMVTLVFQPQLQESTSLCTIDGKVVDKDSGEPIIFGPVVLYRNEVLITGTETDVDGYYKITDIQPGTYDMEASYVGYNPQMIKGLEIRPGRTIRVNFDIDSDCVFIRNVEIIHCHGKLIEIDNTTIASNVTAEKITNLPTKQINSNYAHKAGMYIRQGEDITVTSGRSDETVYYLNGVAIKGEMIPQMLHDTLLGGLESQYENIKETEKSKDNKY